MHYYFILNRDREVLLETEPPSTSSWKNEVRCNGVRIILVSQVETEATYISPRAPTSFAPPLLKSNLQKAVRRGCVGAAVATVWQMLRQGDCTTDLLRRLPIILLEDTLLHPRILPRWIWWMLADSRGYSLSCGDCQQLLADVAFVADPTCSPWRDNLRKTEEPLAPEAVYGNVALFSIWLRTGWGGMTGDMAWLRELARKWKGRDAAAWSRLPTQSPPPIASLASQAASAPFRIGEEGLLEAVDFHVCTRMRTELAAKYGVSERDIQEAIWWHRSERNVRGWFAESEEAEGAAQRAATEGLFQRIAADVEVYARRMWKPLPRDIPKQVSFLQYIAAGKK